MPNRKYSQVYMRYLRARLSNFLRPRFWGTGIFLVVLGLVTKELWFDSQYLSQIENQEVGKELVNPNNSNTDSEANTANKPQITEETLLSNEEKAIAADIDNMPNLLSDVAAANILPINITPSDRNRSNKKESLVDDVINQPNTVNQNSYQLIPEATNNNQQIEIIKNPFLEQANTLLKSQDYYPNNHFVGLNDFTSSKSQEIIDKNNLAINLNYQNVNNPNPLVISPLEAAMNASIYTKQSNNNGLNTNAQMGSLQSTTNLPQTYNSNFNGDQKPQNTGIRIPVNTLTNIPTNNIPNYPNLPQSTSQGIVNSTAPLGYENPVRYNNNIYGVQQPNQSQLPNSNLYVSPGQ
ncbi:hypothetical protein WJM97_13935 [Okeanomitos corallinicola TIOX110]|uniref:Uncharacterized protein n=1 Tax=Okeanomitos corallinicola TIOX110 TaxID=3133117 RepID=A0ABZ2UQT2_9CYAN